MSSFKRTTTLLLLLLASVFCIPLATAEEPLTNTTIAAVVNATSVATTETTVNTTAAAPAFGNCSEVQLISLQITHTKCYSDAEAALNASVSATDVIVVKKAICKAIADKYQCFRGLEACGGNYGGQYANSYLISEFFDKAYSNNVTMGAAFQPFVDSCPVLKEHEANILKIQYNVDNCTFEEVQKSFSNETLSAGNKCFGDFLQAYAKLQGELETEGREKVQQSYCAEKVKMESCLEPFIKCNSAFLTQKTGFLDQFQQTLQEQYPGFSFEKTCHAKS